jgi:hypothetical protein
VEDLRAATARLGSEPFLPEGPAEWDRWTRTTGVRPSPWRDRPALDRPESTLLEMLSGLTAEVGRATTVCVGVLGVEAIRAVTAAAITSLFLTPSAQGLAVEVESACSDRAAFSRFSMLWEGEGLRAGLLETGCGAERISFQKYSEGLLGLTVHLVGMELRGPEVIGSSLRGGEGPGTMSGEFSDSGTGLSLLCSRLECIEEKEGRRELDSQSDMSWRGQVRTGEGR